jgi:peptidoglycan/xylan/chitin deacetylase (PgdA/CDA1 family)
VGLAGARPAREHVERLGQHGPTHLVLGVVVFVGGQHGVDEGQRPVGWLGPGLTQTYETPELLAEAGVKYIGDWVYDDEPTVISTDNGPLVTLPYSVELNDIPTMIVQHHESSYWKTKCCDQFDRLWQEGAERPRIMAIAIHPYISGQPHRIRYLEEIYDHIGGHEGVLHWNGREIYDWYNSQHKVHP